MWWPLCMQSIIQNNVKQILFVGDFKNTVEICLKETLWKLSKALNRKFGESLKLFYMYVVAICLLKNKQNIRISLENPQKIPKYQQITKILGNPKSGYKVQIVFSHWNNKKWVRKCSKREHKNQKTKFFGF